MNFIRIGIGNCLSASGGSGNRPPLIASILQWLTGTSDGSALDDDIDPLIVTPEPVIGG